MPHLSATNFPKGHEHQIPTAPAAGPRGITRMPPHYGIEFVDGVADGEGPLQLMPRPDRRREEQEIPPFLSRGLPPSAPNHTGLPDDLKAGIESISGFDMSDVRVHYNSSKPAALQALAYTQGTDIHVAPGGERHLSHEAWHVVQQKQGRVKPRFQLKGERINDDQGLEHEAEVMGAKVATASHHATPMRPSPDRAGTDGAATQRATINDPGDTGLLNLLSAERHIVQRFYAVKDTKNANEHPKAETGRIAALNLDYIQLPDPRDEIEYPDTVAGTGWWVHTLYKRRETSSQSTKEKKKEKTQEKSEQQISAATEVQEVEEIEETPASLTKKKRKKNKKKHEKPEATSSDEPAWKAKNRATSPLKGSVLEENIKYLENELARRAKGLETAIEELSDVWIPELEGGVDPTTLATRTDTIRSGMPTWDGSQATYGAWEGDMIAYINGVKAEARDIGVLKDLKKTIGAAKMTDMLSVFNPGKVVAYVKTVGEARLNTLLHTQTISASALEKYGAPMMKTFIGAGEKSWTHLVTAHLNQEGAISGGHDEQVFKDFLGENSGYQRIGILLFSLPSALSADLDADPASDAGTDGTAQERLEGLSQRIFGNGRPALTDQATVTVIMKGKHWGVKDGDIQYLIRKEQEGESLKVYDPVPSSNPVHKVTYENPTKQVMGSKTLIKDLKKNKKAWMEKFNGAIWNAIRTKTFPTSTSQFYVTDASGQDYGGYYTEGQTEVDTVYPL